MAKTNNTIVVVKALLRDMLTLASRLHKQVQAAGQAMKESNETALQELIKEFPKMTKDIGTTAAAIIESAQAE